jgi:hypothetical protein
MTIGIVLVAAFAACAAGVNRATNDINPEPHQLLGKRSQQIDISGPLSHFESKVLPFEIVESA